MFAVISTGGKQYRVIKGQRLRVERLIAEVGDELRFDAMLIGGDEGSETRIGTAAAPVGQVRATVFDHGRAKKIEVIKFKRRKDYRRTLGHRQSFTTLEIGGIEPSGKAGAETAQAGKGKAKKAAASKTPAKKAAAKAPAEKAAAVKTPAKKTASAKAPAKKAAAAKAPAKKAAAKAPMKKAEAKKSGEEN